MANLSLKDQLKAELPALLEDGEVRELLVRAISGYFASESATATRFDRLLAELVRDREEQSRKWAAWREEWEAFRAEDARKWAAWREEWEVFRAEDARKWAAWREEWEAFRAEDARKWAAWREEWEVFRAEDARKWAAWREEWEAFRAEDARKWAAWREEWEAFRAEDARKWQVQNDHWTQQWLQSQQTTQALFQRLDRKIDAMGARWGLSSEASFRNALRGILQDSFGVEVCNFLEYDAEGEVFGRPEQVELDLIIQNGLLLVCEIKSSLSKGDLYLFARKVAFYERRHGRQAARKLVISPMVLDTVRAIAPQLDIEIYSDAEDVPRWQV